MGYTTTFEGKFSFSAKPSDTDTLALVRLPKKRIVDQPPWPDGYCQWVLDDLDETGLVWDGGEKFYDYVEWLQCILDVILKPAGLTLTGEVRYQGESIEDAGILRVVDGVVLKEETGIVIADLKAFKDFALGLYGEDLLDAYRRRGGK